jgi:hypothetical protein
VDTIAEITRPTIRDGQKKTKQRRVVARGQRSATPGTYRQNPRTHPVRRSGRFFVPDPGRLGIILVEAFLR